MTELVNAVITLGDKCTRTELYIDGTVKEQQIHYGSVVSERIVQPGEIIQGYEVLLTYSEIWGHESEAPEQKVKDNRIIEARTIRKSNSRFLNSCTV